MARAAYTLILLSSNRTDRVDVGPPPDFKLVDQYHLPFEGADDPHVRVDAALLAIPKVGRWVWILWEGANTQLLDMPTNAVEGLEREQLYDALSFEAETLSGVPTADSAIEGVLQRVKVLPEFRRFWITEIAASLRDKFEDSIVRAGAQFAGVIHPGAFPRETWVTPAPEGAGREWRRIEIWEQFSFYLHGQANGNVETKIIRASPGSENWIAELPTEGKISWMALGPAARVNASGEDIPDPNRVRLWDALMPEGGANSALEAVKIEFPSDAAPVEWLRAWASELNAKQPRIPIVIPPSARVSPYRLYYIVGGLAASFALSISLAHGGYLTYEAENVRVVAEKLEQVRAQNAPPDTSPQEEAKLKAEAEKLQPKLKELEKLEASLAIESARVEKIIAEITARQNRLDKLQSVHRPAVTELIAAIADFEKRESTSQLVIKDVRQEESGKLRLTGLCRQGSLAAIFASKLEQRLSKSGWVVGAAQKSQREDKLAYDFNIELTPAVLLDLPASIARGNQDRLPSPLQAGGRNGTETARVPEGAPKK